MSRIDRNALVQTAGVALVLALAPAVPAQNDSPTPQVYRCAHSDESAPLRELATPAVERAGAETEVPNRVLPGRGAPGPAAHLDPVVQNQTLDPEAPPLGFTFEGHNNTCGCLPPDTNGDVGPSHYFQTVNVHFEIFDKAGNSVLGPSAINSLWSGFGGLCEPNNDGDPVVLYDHLADRWVVTQFALDFFTNDFAECVAISATGDPTGSYYRYEFPVPSGKLNDYPKIGVWPDGYYMSTNQFYPDFTWGGAGMTVFEREQMLQGQPAMQIYFDYGSDPDTQIYGGMLPSDLDGFPPPPPGAPNYFAEVDDDVWGFPDDQIHLWEFHADWSDPNASTFIGPLAIPTASFDYEICTAFRGQCIPQPNTSQKLEGLNDRLMHRLQYRNWGSHETLVVNHTVDAGNGEAGVRWYELRDPSGSPFIYQQGTYSPGLAVVHRWMGSIAMDGDGNIGLGYSASNSTTVFPSLRYTGRLASAPLGALQSEGILYAGGGSQTSTSKRWGDYSAISVDPVDDCTFWYTNEYYQTTNSSSWKTRVGTFAFQGCRQDLLVTGPGAGGNQEVGRIRFQP